MFDRGDRVVPETMQIKSIGIDLGKTTFHLTALGTRAQVIILRLAFCQPNHYSCWLLDGGPSHYRQFHLLTAPPPRIPREGDSNDEPGWRSADVEETAGSTEQ